MALIRLTVLLAFSVIGALVAVAIVARWSDGPIGLLAGGPFRSGEVFSTAAVNWESLAETPQVELQLLNPPCSRTTHIVVHDGQAYVPCGIVKVGPFVLLGQAFWKRWPYEVLKDPRVILRINGRLYEQRAVKVTDSELHRELSSLMSHKYHLEMEQPPDPNKVWFFHLEPREG